MNKDVINISSEDDITDILAHIRSSKQKIVVFVPPQPATILRSSVNIKLIKKAADKEDKVPVFITTDPSLLKLAKEYNLHVSDSLQSKPYIPKEEDLAALAPAEESAVAEDFVKPSDTAADLDSAPDSASDSDSEENSDSDTPLAIDSRKKSKKSSKNLIFDWIGSHKALVIAVSIFLVLLIGFIIVVNLLQSATLLVKIRTTSANFSENVSFTKKMNEEDSSMGVFYLQEESYTDEQKVEFEATGKKDAGEKASGSLAVSAYLRALGETLSIPDGTIFSLGDYTYLTSGDVSLSWHDGVNACENVSDLGDALNLLTEGCLVSAAIDITASEPGEKYNIEAGKTEWRSSVGSFASIINPDAISGGSSKIITVVSQSDIDAATKKLKNGITDKEAKDKLYAKISNTTFPIESSFVKDDKGIKPSVNVGDEATKASISRTTTYKIYVVDSVRLEEFIKKKATLASDQKIYSIGDPFVEHFVESEEKYTAKLKTTYKYGPEVTEDAVFAKISGHKIGEAKSLIGSINGVSSVEASGDYPWVTSFPSDIMKISITVEVEE